MLRHHWDSRSSQKVSLYSAIPNGRIPLDPVIRDSANPVAGERCSGSEQISSGSHPSFSTVTSLVHPLFDAAEREQLCALLDTLGPLAPTCLDSWTTDDLAAQLVLREHDFLAAPGLVIHGAWGRFAERRRLTWKQTAFNELVARIRSGPPPGPFRVKWISTAQPQRVLRLPRRCASGEQTRAARDPGWRRRAVVSQRRFRALVPVTAVAWDRAAAGMGWN